MKPPEKTLETIAAEHGWTLKVIGQRGAQDYQFTKGKARVTFSRRGHGSLSVMWGDFNASWPMTFEGADGRTHRIYEDTREQYAEALVSTLTEEAVHERARALLTGRIEGAKDQLAKAEAALAAFEALGPVQ